MSTSKHAEFILAIDTEYVLDSVDSKKTYQSDISAIEFLKKNDTVGALCIRRRRELENDPRYMQLLPYVVIAKGSLDDIQNLKVLAYYRQVGGGENRLHGKLSIGFGGHVDISDLSFDKNNGVIDLMKTIEQSIGRELDEELNLRSITDKAVFMDQGMITDFLDPVGQFHLGLVALCIVPDDVEFFSGEKDSIELLDFKTCEELIKMQSYGKFMMESWSNNLAYSFRARISSKVSNEEA